MQTPVCLGIICEEESSNCYSDGLKIFHFKNKHFIKRHLWNLGNDFPSLISTGIHNSNCNLAGLISTLSYVRVTKQTGILGQLCPLCTTDFFNSLWKLNLYTRILMILGPLPQGFDGSRFRELYKTILVLNRLLWQVAPISRHTGQQSHRYYAFGT